MRGPLRRGLLAGLLAAITMALATVSLRAFLGVPLPVELINDRLIPSLTYRQFGRLTHLLGGPQAAKDRAYLAAFVIQVLIGVAGGVLLARLARRAERRVEGERAQGQVEGRTAPHRGASPTVLLAAVLLAVWLLATAVLWPVLASSYRGLPPGPAAGASIAGFGLSLAIYLVALVLAFRALAPRPRATASARPLESHRLDRRAFVTGATGAIAGAALGGVAWRLFARATIGPNGYDGHLTKGQNLSPITPNEEFYVVTKNIIDPNVDRGLWRLGVRGLVDRPRTYSFDEIAQLPSVTQFQTLECISNRVGGRLMSNALWKGVPMATLLEAAGPHGGVRTVALHASDGYTHALALDKAMEPTTLVAYEMNGEALPQRHGFPARVLVPGGYGELNVKWVDRIELLDEPFEGYYEKQGWRPGVVHTTSRFDRPFGNQRISLSKTPVVEVGGVAFSGDRGISRVEFSTDGGTTWQEGRIGYAPSPMAWAMWSGQWRPTGLGSYQLTVRAADGTGALQTEQRQGSAPSGATGYHRITVTVEA